MTNKTEKKWRKEGDFGTEYPKDFYKLIDTAKKEVIYKNLNTTLYLKTFLDKNTIFWGIHFTNKDAQQKFKNDQTVRGHIKSNDNQSSWIELESNCFEIEIYIIKAINKIASLGEKHAEILDIVNNFTIFYFRIYQW